MIPSFEEAVRFREEEEKRTKQKKIEYALRIIGESIQCAMSLWSNFDNGISVRESRESFFLDEIEPILREKGWRAVKIESLPGSEEIRIFPKGEENAKT